MTPPISPQSDQIQAVVHDFRQELRQEESALEDAINSYHQALVDFKIDELQKELRSP